VCPLTEEPSQGLMLSQSAGIVMKLSA